MALTNAERQRRHREKLKAKVAAKASASPDMQVFNERRFAWIEEGIRQSLNLGEYGGGADDVAFYEALRNEPLDEMDVRLMLDGLVDSYMTRLERDRRREWDRAKKQAQKLNKRIATRK